MAAGIEVRHRNVCRSRSGGRCNCQPSYRARVHDRHTGKQERSGWLPSETLAKNWRVDALRTLRSRSIEKHTGPTLRVAAGEWIAAARTGAITNRSGDAYKPSAVRGYEYNLRLRVLPELGDKRLGEITRADLQRLVNQLVGEGKSASTITTTITPLRAIYSHALSLDVVDDNPTRGIKVPAVRGRRERIASPIEADLLLAVLEPRDKPLFATALYAGLRRGELAGLLWQDVDLAAGKINVCRSWDAEVGEIKPKSREGTRSVPIPLALRDYLVELRVGAAGDTGRVFRSLKSIQQTVKRAKKRWADTNLKPIGLHECRHTYASLMIAAGVNAKTLSTFMGHANIAITLDRYGHLFPGAEDEAAGMLDAFLAMARKKHDLPTDVPTGALSQ